MWAVGSEAFAAEAGKKFWFAVKALWYQFESMNIGIRQGVEDSVKYAGQVMMPKGRNIDMY